MDSETRQTFRADTQGASTPPLEPIPIPKCPNIRSLDISHFHSCNFEIPFPASVRSLAVSFTDDQCMCDEALRECTELKELTLHRCSVLKQIPPYLTGFSKLRSLNLLHCEGLEDVSVLGHCTNMTALNLSFCTKLEDLSALRSCTNLQTLDLSGCQHLVDVSALGYCTDLRTLDLCYCEELANVSALGSCTNLQTLDLSRCFQLVDISALALCTNLLSLDLGRYKSDIVEDHPPQLVDVSALGSCAKLQSLKLHGGWRICGGKEVLEGAKLSI
eukprot:gene12032-biopygen10007